MSTPAVNEEINSKDDGEIEDTKPEEGEVNDDQTDDNKPKDQDAKNPNIAEDTINTAIVATNGEENGMDVDVYIPDPKAADINTSEAKIESVCFAYEMSFKFISPTYLYIFTQE